MIQKGVQKQKETYSQKLKEKKRKNSERNTEKQCRKKILEFGKTKRNIEERKMMINRNRETKIDRKVNNYQE